MVLGQREPCLCVGTLEGDVVNNPHITMLAKKLLADPMLAHDVLHGLPVVVGAGWHRYGFASGPIVDLHPTPIGEVSGALIHMNLAEAILSGRSYPGLSGSGLMAMEVLTGVAAAVLFAGFSRFEVTFLTLPQAFLVIIVCRPIHGSEVLKCLQDFVIVIV